MGIATYARSFILANEKDNDIGAATKGPGQQGRYTKEAGFLSTYEVSITYEVINKISI